MEDPEEEGAIVLLLDVPQPDLAEGDHDGAAVRPAYTPSLRARMMSVAGT